MEWTTVVISRKVLGLLMRAALHGTGTFAKGMVILYLILVAKEEK